MSIPPLSRCAIYTRQSREGHGDFSSCEAQFEACRQLILAQASQGWGYDGLRYDDEGQSGETYTPVTIAETFVCLSLLIFACTRC